MRERFWMCWKRGERVVDAVGQSRQLGGGGGGVVVFCCCCCFLGLPSLDDGVKVFGVFAGDGVGDAASTGEGDEVWAGIEGKLDGLCGDVAAEADGQLAEIASLGDSGEPKVGGRGGGLG